MAEPVARSIRRRSRAAVLATLMAAMLVSAGRAEADCPEVDDIGVIVLPHLFSNMTTYIAQDAGFFKRHCLKARLVHIDRPSAGFAQVLVGALHFGDSSVGDLLRSRHKSLKLKAVVGASPGIPYSLVVRPGVPLPNELAGYPAVLRDLVGKRIGVAGLDTGPQHFAAALLRGAGLDPSGVVWVAVGPMPEQLTALGTGAVDAVMMADPAQGLAVAGRRGRIVVDLRKPGTGPAQMQGLAGTFQVKVASERFLADHPDIARRYVLATEDAVRFIRDPANHAQVLKWMRARATLGRGVPDSERLFAELVTGYAGLSSAAISRRGFEAWHEFERARGDVKSRITFEEAVWSGAPVSD